MSESEDEARSLWTEAKSWARRKLQPGEPNTFVEGGGNTDADRFANAERARDVDQLEQYEAAYREGGPSAQLIDTRALMTFGTGTEFISDADATTTVAGEELTVDQWLDEQFADRDNLFTQMGRDNYIYGDWFGEIVETKAGKFSHVVNVNPKTLEPRWDSKGQIQRFIQTITRNGQEITESFDPEEIAHVALHRFGRHPLGVSLVGRNWDEISRLHQNQKAIAQALKMHAFTKWHVKAGREGQVVDDTELRRLRQRFNKIRNRDTYLTGADVEIDALDTGGVGEGIGNITENDLTMLAAGFGVPEEMAGLGRGSTEATAKVRLQAFERTARSEQRALADQFIEEVVRPVLDEYSPFDRDIGISLQFDDVVSDQAATAEWLRDFKAFYTTDETREMLGSGPVPEDVDEEDLGPPGEDETPSLTEGFGASLSDGDTPLGNGPGRALLTAEGHADWESAWHHLIETGLWADDAGRALFAGFDDGNLPEFVTARIRETILGDALFSDFETIPSSARDAVQAVMLDSLEEQHGWSIQSVTDNLQAEVDGLSEADAERIARTETQSVVAKSREAGYRDHLDMSEARFDWVGPDDHRNSDVCPWIKAQIPDEGVPLDRLKELIEEGNDKFVDHDAREFTPHISCRHQFVRRVE